LAIYAILPETLAVDDEENTIASNSDSTKNNDEADWLQLLKTSSTWRSLAVAQSGASFGFACKIAVIPILANEYLGGATGAGLLISAAGLAGLVGAPLGGFITDKAGSRFAAATAGSISGLALAFVPIGLSLKDTEILSSLGNESPLLVEGLSSPEAAAFTMLVLLWSIGVSAQGPALTALAQENAPSGSEATALGLPRAVGDGTYIVAPLVLGYFSDQLGDAIPGISCTIAGGAICLGSIALFLSSTAEGEGVKI
jgi:MFS family permease